ncbi:Peptidoglycan-binding (PGRP) domain of peptidoglycan hydrolases-containing protein [Lachnospiraceae bacterium A10]|nr:Peptidoglycan-binding (PGRP) domain of peptidoglycan hydrolases-containing protein [Lachnospiraceae bacterium A10]
MRVIRNVIKLLTELKELVELLNELTESLEEVKESVEDAAKVGTLTSKNTAAKKNIVYILQGGLYCKGYNPNGLDGVYSTGVENAVKKMRTDAGLTNPNGNADGAFMKALLNMDAYVLSSRGDAEVRKIQRNLNRDYTAVIGLIPCDGIFAKPTLKAMIKALQTEQKKTYPGTVVDGIWGTNTMNHCPLLTSGSGATYKRYIYLLQYALYVNGYKTNGFDGVYGTATVSAVKNFQAFAGLSADGNAGKSTWASLYVSYGDKLRKGKACDCMTPLTTAKAKALVADGRKYVGRYIVGGANKCLTLSEEQVIYDAGLKIIPIYQKSHNAVSCFTIAKAEEEAKDAYTRLVNLKFPNGTVFYVSVDFDASDANITNAIVPYFKKFKSVFAGVNKRNYKIGVYGPRYVCSVLAKNQLTSSSFVCDMSSGFSGNIGRKLPSNWALDQISTVTVGTGAGQIQIDNNIASSRCSGASINPKAAMGPDEDQIANRRKAISQNIISKYGLGNGISLNLSIELEQVLLPGPPVEVRVKESLEVEANKNAVYSVSITNGKLEDSEFEVALKDITGKLDAKNQSLVPDYVGMATAIGNGRMEFEVGMENDKVVFSVKCVILEKEVGAGSGDFAVTIKQLWSIEKNAPEGVTQQAWDFFLDNMPKLSVNRKCITVFQLLILAVIIVILCFGGELEIPFFAELLASFGYALPV